ncbi:MAG: hypothetical protein ABJA37_03985 [Ferruginibacter sp.]
MKNIVCLFILSFAINAGFAQVQRKVVKKNSIDSTTSASQNTKAAKRPTLKELNLTKEQRGKLKEIGRQNKAEKNEIENNETLSPGQKEEKVRALKKEHAGKVKNLLNDEQKAKFIQMRRNKRNNR